MERPRCGRPRRAGEPCAAVVRYSVPLNAFAPACGLHLTPAERRVLDTEPLWSTEGQVRWSLRGRPEGDAVLAATRIAEQLGLQQPAVVRALRRLRDGGEVRSETVDRREVWGTAEEFDRRHRHGYAEQRERAAALERRRAEVARDNEHLAAVARTLRTLCEPHAVRVELVCGEPDDPRRPPGHVVTLTIVDPAGSEWLPGLLRDRRES